MPLIDTQLTRDENGLYFWVITAPSDIELARRGLSTPEQREQVHKQYKAQIDTGATGSHVTEKVFKELGLPNYGKEEVLTGGGMVEMWRTAASIYLLGDYKDEVRRLPEVPLNVMADLEDGVDIIIGMDILEHCTLYWNGKRRFFQLAFNQEEEWGDNPASAPNPIS